MPAGCVDDADESDDGAGVDDEPAAPELGAGAVVACEGIAVAGNVESAPTSSSTIAAFANGSGGALGALPAVTTCECTSLTTGTRCRATFAPCTGDTEGDTTRCCGASWGSGAGACSFGTRSSGATNDGIDRDGSGVDDVDDDPIDC